MLQTCLSKRNTEPTKGTTMPTTTPSRRARYFVGAALSVALLTACSTTTGTPTALTPAQVSADLQGALTALSTVDGLIVAASPNAISAANQKTITAVLTSAQTELAALSATTPASSGASTAATIDGYLNTAVGILASVSSAVPGLSTFSPEIDAVDAVLPAVEAFVNQYLPANVTAARFAPRAHSTRFTLDQARAVLHIAVAR
jgi:hypothetical protein